jgi:signal transduction histidine kinase
VAQVIGSPGNSDSFDPGEIGRSRWPSTLFGGALKTGFWVARLLVFGLVCVLTVGDNPDHRVFEVSVVVLGGALLVAWAVYDWRSAGSQPLPTWSLPVILGFLAATGGLGTALKPYNAPVAFTVAAAIEAGSSLALGTACAVATVGIVSIEISGAIFGLSTGTAVGIPLLVVVSLLVGRDRRQARIRGEQAAALVTQMQLTQGEQRRAAALGERNRIAREIHDVLAHSISALGIQIEAARAVLRESGDVAATLKLLDGAQRLAEDGLTDSRRAIMALRADTPSLDRSIATLVENHERQHDTTVDVTVRGDVRPLQPDANLALIRVVHEGLTNAAKHAPSSPVFIRLDYGDDRTELTISNSLNEDVSVKQPGLNGGFGLTGMRERLLLIDGGLSAGPAEGGWIVRATVPQ